MAKLDENLTIKKIDIAINSFKAQKTGASESTKNTLDRLITKYTNRKTLILSIYYKNLKKNINLKGIDKSMLSIALLAKLGAKESALGAVTRFAGDIVSHKGVMIGVGTTAAVLTSARILEQTVGLGTIATGFAENVWPAIVKGLGFAAEASVTQTVLAGAALGVGGLLVAGLIVKKIRQKQRQRILAQEAADKAMDAGVKSKQFESFHAGKFNEDTIANEIVNDPNLREHLDSMLAGTDPAITPVMKSNIRAALLKADMMELNAYKEEEKTIINGHVYNVDKNKLANYAKLKLQDEALEKIDKAVKAAAAPAVPGFPNISITKIKSDVEQAKFKADLQKCLTAAENEVKAKFAGNPNVTLSGLNASKLDFKNSSGNYGLAAPDLTALKTTAKNAVEDHAKAYLEEHQKTKAAKDKAIQDYNNEYGAAKGGVDVDEVTYADQLNPATLGSVRNNLESERDSIFADAKSGLSTDISKMKDSKKHPRTIHLTDNELKQAIENGTLAKIVENERQGKQMI